MSEHKWPLVAVRLGLASDASERVAYMYKSLMLDFERRVFPGLSIVAQSEMRKMSNISAKTFSADQAEKTIPPHVYRTSEGNSPRFVRTIY